MNNIDEEYRQLLMDILIHGVKKEDRTGTGTHSIFGRQIRHNMKEGFPLLTTKKMPFKTIITELLWFLRGDTNIKFLVDNGCNVWNGDAYKRYKNVYDIESRESTYALKELHMLSDLTKEEFTDKIKTDDEFAKKWGELGPIYGKQWRSWKTNKTVVVGHNGNHNEFGTVVIDQIQNVIDELKTNPDSRRLMVNVWNVGELDQMVLPPCHYGFQVYTRELSEKERMNTLIQNEQRLIYEEVQSFKNVRRKKIKNCLDERNIPTRAISLIWNQRSVDTFLGLPFNIASYGLLLEIIAKSVNMVPDELIGNLGDTHLYSNHIEQAKEQISRTSFELPKLQINSGNENWHLLEIDEIINSFDIDITFKLENYQSHPSIKAPLSN
jgi:thymidylate synthase